MTLYPRGRVGGLTPPARLYAATSYGVIRGNSHASTGCFDASADDPSQLGTATDLDALCRGRGAVVALVVAP